MYTQKDIDEQIARGMAQEARLTKLWPAFDEAGKRAPSVPVTLDTDMHAAMKAQMDPVIAQIRATRTEILVKEVDLAIRIVGENLKRLHMLMRDRKPIYADRDIQRCINDINIHVEQTDMYFTRIESYYEAIGSNDIDEAQEKVLSDGGSHVKLHQYNFGKIQDWMPVVAAGPVPQEKEDEYFSYTDPLPQDIRAAFIENNMTLGKAFMEYRDLLIERMENTIDYLTQIDTRLIPLKLEDAETLFSTREDRLTELQACGQSMEGYANHVNVYLTHAMSFFVK